MENNYTTNAWYTSDALNKNLEEKQIENCKSKFHTQVLTSWIKLHQTDPISTDEILNEYLVLNKHILIGDKTIQTEFFGENQ